MRRAGFVLSTIAAMLGSSVSGTTIASASSHREALAVLNEPCADNTDTYAWVKPGDHSKLYLIMNFNPLHEPGQGNQGLRACDGYRYQFHIGIGKSLDGPRDLSRRVQKDAHAGSGAEADGSPGRRQRAPVADHRRHRNDEGHPDHDYAGVGADQVDDPWQQSAGASQQSWPADRPARL